MPLAFEALLVNRQLGFAISKIFRPQSKPPWCPDLLVYGRRAGAWSNSHFWMRYCPDHRVTF